MLAFILRRLIQAVIVMVTVAFISFMLFQYVGDPVVFLLGQDATPEQIRELRASLGLDKPFFVQFWHFLVNASQGEFGLSLRQGAKVSRLIAEAPPGFEVYSGDDWAAFGYACLGAVGVVSVASHLVGPQIHQMLELIGTGDVPAARKIHEQLSPLFNALFITSNPIPVKAALNMLGRPAGVPRLPLVPATPEEQERVRAALEDAGLL